MYRSQLAGWLCKQPQSLRYDALDLLQPDWRGSNLENNNTTHPPHSEIAGIGLNKHKINTTGKVNYKKDMQQPTRLH